VRIFSLFVRLGSEDLCWGVKKLTLQLPINVKSRTFLPVYVEKNLFPYISSRLIFICGSYRLSIIPATSVCVDLHHSVVSVDIRSAWLAVVRCITLTLSCDCGIVIVSVAGSRYFTTGPGTVWSFCRRPPWRMALADHSANSSINHLFLTANWFSAVADADSEYFQRNASLPLLLADSDGSDIRFLNSICYLCDASCTCTRKYSKREGETHPQN